MNKDIEYIVWDLETTGFNAPVDKILEIGCFVVKNNSIEEMHWILDNKIDVPERITEITGITNDIIDKEGRDPKECLMEFLPLFKRCKKNITHNGIRFDIPFLLNYAEDILKFTPKQKKWAEQLITNTAFDTAVKYKADKMNAQILENDTYLDFANRIMNTRVFGLKYNLGEVCDTLDIDRSNVTQHRALGDVFLTHKVYEKYGSK